MRNILKSPAKRFEFESNNKRIKKLNQNGIALLNVIIFSAILGLMGLAFMQLTDQQNKSLESSKTNLELYEFVDKVRIALSSPEACLKTFEDKPYASAFTVDNLYRTYIDPNTQKKVTTRFATVDEKIAPGYKLFKIELKNVDIVNRKGFVELTMEKIPGEGFGVASIKKSFEIIALDPGSPNPVGTITNCFTTGTNIDDPKALCTSLGGVWDPNKRNCDGIVAIDPTPVACSKFSKRRLTQDAKKRLQIVCDPCIPVDKFDKWVCEFYPGKSTYSNMCYYRKVCQNSTNDTMRPSLWDGVRGPTTASGKDSPSHSACVSKRKLCNLEPVGMAENVSAP